MKKIIEAILKVLGIIFLVLSVACAGLFIYIRFFTHSTKEVNAKDFYISELPLQPSEFAADFEEVHQIVMENYSLYKNKKLDMDSLYRVYSTRASEAKTTTDYGLLVQEYISALKCSHANTYYKYYSANGKVKLIEGTLFVDQPGRTLLEAGFKDKDRIVAINGIPSNEWIKQASRLFQGSTPTSNRQYALRSVFNSLTDTMRTYTIEREGETINLQIELIRPQNRLVEAKILQDSIGYLAINSMSGSVLEQFTEAYPLIKKLPHLIIDIRANGGGNSNNGAKICQYFIRKKQPHCLSTQYPIVGDLTPNADAYKGKVYLLISPRTCSAAESFAIDMRESGNVTLVGEITSGDTGNNPKNFGTSRGTYFRLPTKEPALSPQGFPMEGVGIPPHHEVTQTIEDFMKNEDTVLNYTLGLIEASSFSR